MKLIRYGLLCNSIEVRAKVQYFSAISDIRQAETMLNSGKFSKIGILNSIKVPSVYGLKYAYICKHILQ